MLQFLDQLEQSLMLKKAQRSNDTIGGIKIGR
jgi:hypothetical protein